ncbi:CHAT domain-containing protein/tetratricopeptide (TPR) repeat protein [Methanolinea mesophila]|uniref:CHAT domain-containing tetratricopeptide repeat protein n=1 Tax=Methanolinea mesophila TaxID=547055 RepID=UPI001AEA55C3|nr:CHAT domain-containing protein/tetratricopeptide (TPR) repeat protein [Methanolinea mesophila]
MGFFSWLKRKDESRESSESGGMQNSSERDLRNRCDLVLSLIEKGNFKKALPLADGVLEDISKYSGKESPDYAIALNNLAYIHLEVGNYATAESLFNQAITLWQQYGVEDHPDYATALDNLASIYQLKGNYQGAESLYKQAIGIRKKELGEDNPDYAMSLNNLGMLYRSLGNYEEAVPLIRQTIEIVRKTLGEDHPDHATYLNNLAELYREMGNAKAAEPLIFRAINIHKKTIGEDHPDIAIDLNNLALVYQDMGDYREAETYFQKSLSVVRKTLGQNHPEYALFLYNLANLYLESGDYESVEDPLQKSMEIWRRNGANSLEYARCLNTQAWLSRHMGHYQAAEPPLREAIEIYKSALGEDHPDYTQLLHNLADLCIATGRIDEGYRLMNIANKTETKLLEQVLVIGSDQQRLSFLDSIGGNYDKFLSVIFSFCSQSPPALSRAYELVLKRKAIGAEAFAVQRDAILGGKYPQFREQLGRLRELKMQIAQTILASPGIDHSDQQDGQLEEWKAESERIEFELADNAPEMKFELHLSDTDQKDIDKNLPPESVLLEFVCFDPFDFTALPSRGEPQWLEARYGVFIIKYGEPGKVQVKDLGKADEINSLILQFQTACAELDENYLASGGALYGKIINPLVPLIGDTQNLIIAPDGELNLLSFDALPITEGEYLIDKFHIFYISVGRDIIRFSARRLGKVGKPLVIANPAYDLSQGDEQTGLSTASFKNTFQDPGQRKLVERISRDIDRERLHFDPLPESKVEGEKIASMLNVNPLIGLDAVEGKIKSRSSPHILHIATHGFFLKNQYDDTKNESTSEKADLRRLSRLENPLLRSGLALAGVNTWARGGTLPPEAEDGLLNGEDVTGLDLTATDLVVLSACETGVGEVKKGEGVFGLRRAFILAGAKTLVMSLWSVEEDSTRTVMMDFYRRIQQGVPKADALREAKLALRKSYPHPFFWGPFICQGDPGPLSGIEELPDSD